MNRTSSLALALVIGAGALTGCGAAADKVAEKATEKAIESQTGGDVDVNTNGDGSFNIETDDGSLSIGTGKLPDGWPDDISITDTAIFDHRHVQGHRQLTDVYLLALAVRNGGRLVTFDRRLSIESVRGAKPENLVILPLEA